MHQTHKHSDTLAITDNVEIIVHDHRTGKDTLLTTHNLVTDGGRDAIAGLLSQQYHAEGFTHLSVGTGTTAAATTDTALVAEVYKGLITRTGPGTNVGEAIAEYYLQRAQANDNTIREIGLWCGDVLYARALVPGGVPKTKDYSVTFIWTTQLGVA